MNVIKKIFSKLPRLHSVKYILALIVATVLIGFGGGNSLWAHFGYMSRIGELNNEIDQYDGQYRRDQAQIRELKANPKSMERIARELYYMKAADEDIFVLSDDQKEEEPHATAE